MLRLPDQDPLSVDTGTQFCPLCGVDRSGHRPGLKSWLCLPTLGESLRLSVTRAGQLVLACCPAERGSKPPGTSKRALLAPLVRSVLPEPSARPPSSPSLLLPVLVRSRASAGTGAGAATEGSFFGRLSPTPAHTARWLRVLKNSYLFAYLQKGREQNDRGQNQLLFFIFDKVIKVIVTG